MFSKRPGAREGRLENGVRGFQRVAVVVLGALNLRLWGLLRAAVQPLEVLERHPRRTKTPATLHVYLPWAELIRIIRDEASEGWEITSGVCPYQAPPCASWKFQSTTGVT